MNATRVSMGSWPKSNLLKKNTIRFLLAMTLCRCPMTFSRDRFLSLYTRHLETEHITFEQPIVNVHEAIMMTEMLPCSAKSHFS